MAQVIVATQMVYEQKYVMHYNVPALQAVGWEGYYYYWCVFSFHRPKLE